MRFGTVFAVVGMILAVVGGLMLVPALYGLLAGEPQWGWFLLSAALTAVFGLLLRLRCAPQNLTAKDSFGIVGFGWFFAAFFGSLPFFFILDRGIVDCLFESISGITTTGATMLDADDIDYATGYFRLPGCLLLWRSMIQWVGGLGVIMMILVILPFLEGSGLQILRAEVTVISQKIRPKMRDTGLVLAGVYVLLTALDALSLWIAGMTLFDAVCHSFTTLSTGGFSPNAASIEGYANVWIEWVTVVFMFAGGASFLIHYRALTGDWRGYFRSSELRLMALLVLGFAATATLNRCLIDPGISVGRALRETVFTGMSIITTTGYTNSDFSKWPTLTALVLVLLMFAGGCVGSTGGAVKMRRILILLKALRRELRLVLHPNRVLVMKVDGETIEEAVVRKVFSFAVFWIGLFVLMSLVLAAFGHNMITSLTGAASCLGNVGPALGDVYANYATMGIVEKIVLMAGMLIGRLEIFSILILFSPLLWKRPLR